MSAGMNDLRAMSFLVEKGSPSEEELAALTVVLLARAAALGAASAEADCAVARAVAGWRRPERVAGFDGPRTWRRAA